MLAVIRTGGKQYIVEPKTKLKIEKLEKAEGETIVFSDVLLIENDGKLEIGNPVVKGAEVEAKVLRQDKAEKIIVFKYKPKKRYKRKIGHRQPFTEIEILSIKN
jgi:large subunit ribosomal protein L21